MTGRWRLDRPETHTWFAVAWKCAPECMSAPRRSGRDMRQRPMRRSEHEPQATKRAQFAGAMLIPPSESQELG